MDNHSFEPFPWRVHGISPREKMVQWGWYILGTQGKTFQTEIGSQIKTCEDLTGTKYPQIILFNRDFPYKPSILGHTHIGTNQQVLSSWFATSHEPHKNHPKEQVADSRKCQVHTCTWSAQRTSKNVAIIVVSIGIIITITTMTTLITTLAPVWGNLYCIQDHKSAFKKYKPCRWVILIFGHNTPQYLCL